MNIKVKLTKVENCTHYHVNAGDTVLMDLEAEYLPICLSCEIYEDNNRTPMEAKKAQAVAARTYAVSFIRKNMVISDTPANQAFSWKALSTIPNCVAAISQTNGQILECDGTIITAWYSSSNGGRTKRSDEAWSAATPWTVSKDDPWDAAGRKKWNITKIAHGVGMSQIGASYAATIGVLYRDILTFYYPNTTITSNDGVGMPTDQTTSSQSSGVIVNTPTQNDLVAQIIDQLNSQQITPVPLADGPKTNIGLVAHARNWLGNPYWYGTCCYACTTGLLRTKSLQYPTHYGASRMPKYQKDIANHKSCADCIGLIKGYQWMKNGVVTYDKATDVSASGILNIATVKGVINTLPEVPGLILNKTGHVGIYEGNGSVIEAKGFAYGIIRSKLTDTKWMYWLVNPFISYAGYEEQLLPKKIKTPYTAIVMTKLTPLNIWKDPSKTKSLLLVNKGDTLTVTGYADRLGWYTVEKDGIRGVCDGQYLVAQGS